MSSNSTSTYHSISLSLFLENYGEKYIKIFKFVLQRKTNKNEKILWSRDENLRIMIYTACNEWFWVKTDINQLLLAAAALSDGQVKYVQQQQQQHQCVSAYTTNTDHTDWLPNTQSRSRWISKAAKTVWHLKCSYFRWCWQHWAIFIKVLSEKWLK